MSTTPAGWAPGPRPDWVTLVNAGAVDAVTDGARRPFDRDALLREALAMVGEGDVGAFGDDGFLEPLDVLLGALEDEADLSLLGRWLTHRFLLRLLVVRLHLERYVADDPGVRDEVIDAPLFIVGAPRTGTTVLHALMVQDGNLRAPLGWELLRPVPPPRPPEEDGRVELAETELRMLAMVAPAMDTIHEYGSRNPKECVSAMSFEFRSEEFTARYRVPSYQRWLQSCDMRPAYERHRQILQVLQRRTGRAAWVLKSPVHLQSLPTLLAVYPDARLVVTHRDPLAVLASVSSLVANLRWVHSDAVDLHEIGQYHLDLYGRSLNDLARRDSAGDLPAERVVHAQYTELRDEPLEVVRECCARLGVPVGADADARRRAYLAGRPQDRHGAHSYDFADLGQDERDVAATFDPYVRHFRVPAEAPV